MKKIFTTKILSAGVIFIIAATFFIHSIPRAVYASLLPPFGAYDDFDDYEMCDCSGAIYSWFGPLYLGPVPTSAPLTWYPGTIEFSYYIPHPGAALLGTYVPGVPACAEYVGEGCVDVPALGNIAPETGVSAGT